MSEREASLQAIDMRNYVLPVAAQEGNAAEMPKPRPVVAAKLAIPQSEYVQYSDQAIRIERFDAVVGFERRVDDRK